jgi:hypothetical protein
VSRCLASLQAPAISSCSARYVPLGAAGLLYIIAVARYFWPASQSRNRAAAAFVAVPAYAWLLAAIVFMNAAVLAISVLFSLYASDAATSEFLISALCVVPLGVHALLFLMTARWRMVHVLATATATFVPWLALVLVYDLSLTRGT